MNTYRFNDKLYKKYLTRMMLINAIVVIVVYLLVQLFNLPELIVGATILICWLIINRPMHVKLDPNIHSSNIEVLLNTDSVTVYDPTSNYKFTKQFSEFKGAEKLNYLGIPIIRLEFLGNEVIHLVGLESSDNLFEKICKRLK